MRILIAGATGAIGRALIPKLVSSGNPVVGMAKSDASAEVIRSMGAESVQADALDLNQVREAVRYARPEVIVHQLTAIPRKLDLRHFEKAFATTNLLRTKGTDHLAVAASENGVRKFVAQSFGGWPYAREGGPVKTENDPLDPDPPKAFRTTLSAIRHVEKTTTSIPGVEGIALRYGAFYGPGNAIGEGGDLVDQVRRRRVPIIGEGTGVWSFIHIDDAATATVAAIESGAEGVYNVVDDDPAPVAEWLPRLAAALGAKPPFHIPRWLARIAVGEHAVTLMNEIRGASNAKAKRALDWRPRWATWREGFAKGLGEQDGDELSAKQRMGSVPLT